VNPIDERANKQTKVGKRLPFCTVNGLGKDKRNMYKKLTEPVSKMFGEVSIEGGVTRGSVARKG